MHVQSFLHKKVSKSLTGVDPRRVNSIFDIASGLLNEASLTLTSLGRHLKGSSQVKSNIKRVDRLLGNPHVYNEQRLYYRALCHSFFSGYTKLEINVDWSGCNDGNKTHVLRASVSTKGRALPIYQEVHSIESFDKEEVNSRFLENLKSVIPDSVEMVIIVTDAGFRRPWFHKVLSLGWEFVGRARGKITYSLEGKKGTWQPVKSLHDAATQHVRFVGEFLLGRSCKPLSCKFYTYKGPLKGRKKQKKKGMTLRPNEERKMSSRHREPWVLVTSLSGAQQIASRVKNIYGRRMQIEQNFRDDKNERWGFGFRYSRSKTKMRKGILFLLAAIATYMLWLVGLTGEYKDMQGSFQANTVKHKRVLSLITLGKQILFHRGNIFRKKDYSKTLNQYSMEYRKCIIGQ